QERARQRIGGEAVGARTAAQEDYRARDRDRKAREGNCLDRRQACRFGIALGKCGKDRRAWTRAVAEIRAPRQSRGRMARGQRAARGTQRMSETAGYTKDELETGRKLFAGEWDFIAGAGSVESLPAMQGIEVAFAGRSNVGKSSLINALTGRKA